jgi:hypothetical protein
VNHAEFWSHTAGCLRTGEPFLRMDGEPHGRELSKLPILAFLLYKIALPGRFDPDTTWSMIDAYETAERNNKRHAF